MNGWIKLHRKIEKHWIFKDSEKLRSWIIILLTVNHNTKKMLIGEQLFICKRGQSLNSLDTWGRLFGRGWNKSRVRRLFSLLQKDSMIELKNEQKTTRLTVCNYDSYQETRNVSETSLKQDRNASETSLTPNKKEENNKNDKEGKEESVINKNTHPALISFRNNVFKESKEMNIDDHIALKFFEYWSAIEINSKQFLFQVTENFALTNKLKGWIRIESENKTIEKIDYNQDVL